MWRSALRRGAAAGAFVVTVALIATTAASADPSPEPLIQPQPVYNDIALWASLIASLTAIVVASIYAWSNYQTVRRADRDPRMRATSTEATDALLDQLVEERRENDRLRERERRRETKDGHP